MEGVEKVCYLLSLYILAYHYSTNWKHQMEKNPFFSFLPLLPLCVLQIFYQIED